MNLFYLTWQIKILYYNLAKATYCSVQQVHFDNHHKTQLKINILGTAR
ncbi:MAG: hypothetical protein ACJAVX_003825 [Pseudoalteromonas rhizosphaerae]|jgi:hypothetical protein